MRLDTAALSAIPPIPASKRFSLHIFTMVACSLSLARAPVATRAAVASR